MSNRGERNAVISGVGQSQVGRRIYRDPLDLTIEATFDALDDAGLTVKDIDGISTYPGNMGVPPGFSGVGVTELQEALHLELEWFAGGVEAPGQFGSVINAIAAVAIGLCRHVICFRTVWEASAQGDQGRASVTAGGGGGGGGGGYRADGFMQWTLPFGAPSAANWIGMMAQRHFHEFGTTREQLAQIALNGRKNAALNPKAIYTDPMTMEDYLGVRMVSEPLCLYDCDVPADGSTVVIVSAAETAGDLRRPPVRIEAVGSALRGRNSWDQFDDLTTMAARDAGKMMWERSDLTPGRRRPGRGLRRVQLHHPLLAGGPRLLRSRARAGRSSRAVSASPGTGELPLNTHGGQLSAGRLHGYGFLHEACTQLWGQAGERQVAGDPEVAVAAAGGGPLAASLVLTRS